MLQFVFHRCADCGFLLVAISRCQD